jgi:hypothetical protein
MANTKEYQFYRCLRCGDEISLPIGMHPPSSQLCSSGDCFCFYKFVGFETYEDGILTRRFKDGISEVGE